MVEVIIVIALIAILSAIMVVSLQRGRVQEQVNSAQNELASAVKLAQSFALQGRKQGGSVPKCYGVRGNASGAVYRIYYTNDSSCDLATYSWAETYNLSNGVRFSAGFDFKFDVPHGNVESGGTATLSKSPATSRNVILDMGGGITKN